MSNNSSADNPVIKRLVQFHKEHQDDMPGGAEKLLKGLLKANITDSAETALHFDKQQTLHYSGGSVLSDESKRKRVLQLNNHFEELKTEFKVTSRKNAYILAYPDSLTEKLENQAFEEYALGIADETDPEDYQVPEVTTSQLVFVSHNWRDKETRELTNAFVNELNVQLADRASANLNIKLFCDLLEENGFSLTRERLPQQDEKCEQAQLCLVLWNPGYEQSTDCKRELAYFIDEEGHNHQGKAAIALLERGRMKDLFNSSTSKLAERVLFNYPADSETSLAGYWEKATADDKYQYVASLVDHIHAAFSDKQSSNPAHHRLRKRLIEATDKTVEEGLEKDLYDGTKHQIPEGFEGSLSTSNRIEIVPCLTKWVGSKVSATIPRVSVLLGDFGFGKTVTCRLLAQQLSELYKESGQTTHLPIYLDLKALLKDLDNHLNQPVEHLLETMLAKTGKSADFKGHNVIHYIQTQKCLVIFDGFDEIGHKLSPPQQQSMYHKLLDIIPSGVYINDRRPPDHKKWNQRLADFQSKLLISCRTHFFNHIRQETSFLTGSERHAIADRNIQRFYMAPFKPEAIMNYLIDALGNDEEGTQAYNMLGDIHDLSDLSKHPIMLRLISQQIPFLQEMKAQGMPVNSASLYSQMFNTIGERDNAKHIIKLSRKQKLLAALAFDLWLQGNTQLYFEKLEDWFTDYSGSDSLLFRQTADPQIFESMVTDLCNATLLVRDAEDKYRFAHTSYLEFFRALGIFEFIRCQTRNAIHSSQRLTFNQLTELPELNNETLQFIINWWQVCNEDERQEFNIGFIQLLEKPDNQQSKWLGFYIWRFALESLGHPIKTGFPHSNSPDWSEMDYGYDFISPIIVKSIFADLEDSIPKIDLNWANFSGSYFFEIHFLKLNLNYANFAKSSLNQCHFTDVSASENVFAHAILRHTHHPSLKIYDIERKCKKLKILKGHFESINALCYNSDGTLLASAGEDEVIRIWDTRDPLKQPICRHILKGHLKQVTSLVFSHDSSRLASSGRDNVIRIWDVDDPNKSPGCVHTFHSLQQKTTSLQFSRDSKYLASAGLRTIRLWDTSNANELPKCTFILNEHKGQIYDLHFSHDNKRLASTGLDKTVRIWDLSKKENQPPCIHVLKGHRSEIYVVRFNHDSTQLVSAGYDAAIRVWDTSHTYREPICIDILNGHQSEIYDLQYSNDSKILVSAGNDKTIRIWDTPQFNKTAKCKHLLSGHMGNIKALQFNADNTRLASTGEDKTIHLWDTSKTLNKPQHVYILKGHECTITALQFSHNLQLLASAGVDNTIRLWDTAFVNTDSKPNTDMAPNTEPPHLCKYILKGHEDAVMVLQFSHDSQLLASAGVDNIIRLWDTANTDSSKNRAPVCKHILKGHEDSIIALQFSDNSQLLASAGVDNVIRLWDTANAITGQPPLLKHILKGHESSIQALQFSHNSQILASAGHDYTIRLWDTSNINTYEVPLCKHVLKDHDREIMALQFSSNSQMLASAGYDKTIRLWDTTNANKDKSPVCRYVLKGHEDWINTLQFSHNSQVLASAGLDQTIRLWDCSDMRQKPHCITVLTSPEFGLRSLQFSGDDKYLYCSSFDEILIWDMQSFQCIKAIRQLPDGYTVFATESDGKQIIYKELLAAQGDSWDYLHALDDEVKPYPAACYKDWDRVYQP